MAMTKAEREQVQELRVRLSLAFPQFPKPEPVPVEVMKAELVNGLFVGWWMNPHTGYVGQGCFDGGLLYSSHSTTKPDSRTVVRMYRSKIEALQAMRWAATERAMWSLRAIDNQIEAEGRDAFGSQEIYKRPACAHGHRAP